MIEKIMKAVKSGNKKRGRNITVGAVVGMLLSCTAVMGANEYLWIKSNGGIKFSTDNSTPVSTGNPYGENTWNGTDYVNNIILNSTSSGYGLKLSGDLSGINFTNNGLIAVTGNNLTCGISNEGTIGDITNTGLITGTSAGDNFTNGNGIYNKGTMGNITNRGLIIGTNTGNQYGHGIYNDYESNKIGDITNTGLIIGTGPTYRGYGIYNNYSKTMGNITNTGLIIGIGNIDGAGIYNAGTMGIVMNTGLIAGIGKVNSSGIYLNAGSTTTTCNEGVIIAQGKSSTYGIYNNGHLTEEIVNNGLISLTNTEESNAPGSNSYGIRALDSGITKTIQNNGLVLGRSINGENNCGIYNQGDGVRVSNIGSVVNIATGTANVYGIRNSNGHNSRIASIVNSGLITGTSTGSGTAYGIFNKQHESNGGKIGDIANTGVIYGKTNTVKNETGGEINSLRNYGILATEGSTIIESNGTITNAPLNYGLYIEDSTGIVTVDPISAPTDIIVGYDDSGNTIRRNMTIKNAAIQGGSGIGTSTDSFVFSATPNEFDNSILNGKNDTLKVSGTDREVKGAIINAYGTAVAFDGIDSQLTLSGTIVNGGVDGKAAVSGSGNGDTLILQAGEITYVGSGSPVSQNTVINGNIDMLNGNNKITLKKGSAVNGIITTGTGADTIAIENGAVANGEIIMGAGEDNLSLKSGAIVNEKINMGDDNDTLTIEKGSMVNGTLDGGTGNDTLNFNPETTRALGNSEINIQHNISDFENMNINTNVTLFEKTIADDGTIGDLAITGAENITIGANGILTLRLDITNIDNISGTDKIKGHALYGNNGTITSTGGKLLLALNGAGNESVISFGDTTLDGSLVTAHETKIEGEINFATTSLLHKVKRVEGTTNEVIITSKADLVVKDNIAYEKLNEIYHSILSVDELGNFNVDDDEKLSTFLSYLNDIYAGNPYSYSSELSRKSAGMFRDIVTENIFKPETNKWMIYGGLTHVDGGTKDTYYGKGYYTYDIGSSDMDADTKITGAYMLGEYGISDTLTSGVVIGGNKLKSDLSNGSKVDGSALYLGAYAKKYVGNLKVTAGAGFQYGDYDADRLAVNKVASDTEMSVMKYSDNYNDITYDIYLNGRYSHNIGDNLFLEPYGTLSYTYIDQDEADEGNKTLAIETDSKSFDYTVGKVGVDLKKVIPHEKGKSTLSAGINYTKILDGADEEHITGRFKGGSDFDILVAHKNEHSIGLNAKYALELENGVLFDVKGTYSVERDSHNGSGKNRTKGEWIVGAGVGYKF